MKWMIILVSILAFNITAIKMKKHLKPSEIYSTVLFSLLVSNLVDIYASFRFKAWGFFEPEKAEFSVMLVTLGIYPAAAAIIINFFPYRSSWRHKLGYLIGWDVFSTAYEWMTLKTGILWHIHWNLTYSFIMYPCIYYMIIFHVRFYRWMKLKAG